MTGAVLPNTSKDIFDVRRPMPIPALTSLVTRCWTDAEKNVRQLLAKRHHDKNEDFITEVFHDELRQSFQNTSSTFAVEHAFISDLERAFPHLQHSADLKQITNGISVTTTLHPREIEKKTGGDLGIMFVRPNVTEQMPSQFAIDLDYRRGLLCQAKIKRRQTAKRKARWGSFTPNQKKVLPNRLEYLALILYEYIDAERQHLAPFRWQLCSGTKLSDVEQWLNSDYFPRPLMSDIIITQLGRDKIGTDDKKIIDQYICPRLRDTLVIKIGWPPGQGPEALIRLPIKSRQREKQYVYVYQR